MHIFEGFGQKQGLGACRNCPCWEWTGFRFNPSSERQGSRCRKGGGSVTGFTQRFWDLFWAKTEPGGLWNLVAIGKEVLIPCDRDHSKCRTASVWWIVKILPPDTHAWHNYKVHESFLLLITLNSSMMYAESVTSQVFSSRISGNVYFTMPVIKPGLYPVWGSNPGATTN